MEGHKKDIVPRIADYFIVAKIRDPVKTCGLSESESLRQQKEGGEGKNASKFPGAIDSISFTNRRTVFPSEALHYSKALVDIQVCFPRQGEKVPYGYRILSKTPCGNSADTNSGVLVGDPVYICLQFQGDSGAEGKLPIVDVGLAHMDKNERFLPNFTLVRTTVGGRPANLNHGQGGRRIYLVVKRLPQVPAAQEVFHSTPLVTDICIINNTKKEDPPLGYVRINRSTNEGNWTGHQMHLCLKFSEPVGLLDHTFHPSVASRFPSFDYPEYSCPDLVPLFCAPTGLTVARHHKTEVPLPVFGTFVLTQQGGTKIYGSCLQIAEQLNRGLMSQLLSDFEKHLLEFSEKNPQNKFLAQRLLWVCRQYQEEEEGRQLDYYSNTCIAILSHHPYFAQFKQFLCQLYQVLLSPSPVPIERYVGHFMTKLRFPFEHSPPTVLKFGSAHDAQEPITFKSRTNSGFPDLSFDLDVLFRYLSVENVTTVVNLLLLEEKVVIHSSHTSVLTMVAECLQGLLFPLAWQCVYIPVCPVGMLEIVREAPMAFLIGVHSKWATSTVLPPGIWAVDLDVNTVKQTAPMVNVPAMSGSDSLWIQRTGSKSPSGSSTKQRNSGEISPISLGKGSALIAASHALPTQVRNTVVKRLNEAVHQHAIVFRTKPADPDAAFGVAPFEHETQAIREQFSRTVRSIFLCMMVDLIGGYRDHLVPLQARPAFMGSLSPLQLPEIFDVEGFVASETKSHAAFLKELVKTQAFTKFCDERTFSVDRNLGPRFLFFDTAVETQRSEFGHNQRRASQASAGRVHAGQATSPARKASWSGRRRQSVHRNSVLNAASHLLPSKAIHSYSRRKSSGGLRRSSQAASVRTRPALLLDAVIETQRPSKDASSPRLRSDSEKTENNLVQAGGGQEAFAQDLSDTKEQLMENMMNLVLKNRQQMQYDSGRFRRSSSMITPPSYLLSSLWKADDQLDGEQPTDVKVREQLFQYDQFPKLKAELIHPYETFAASKYGLNEGNDAIKFSQGASKSLRLRSMNSVSIARMNITDVRVRSASDFQRDGEYDTSSDNDTDTDSGSDVEDVLGSAAGPADGQETSAGDVSEPRPLTKRTSGRGSRVERKQRIEFLFDSQAHRARKLSNRGSDILKAKPYSTLDSSDIRGDKLAGFTLAGVRTHSELENSRVLASHALEVAAGSGQTGPLVDWVLHTLLELLGTWFACMPALVIYSPAPRHALLVAFSVMDRARRQGLLLDEACYRALLIACGHCGSCFAPDAERIFKEMHLAGINPNALTYGYYSQAVTKEEQWGQRAGSRKRLAHQRWTRIRVVKEVFVALFRLRRRSLASLAPPERSRNNRGHFRVATSLEPDLAPSPRQASLRGRSGRSFSLDEDPKAPSPVEDLWRGIPRAGRERARTVEGPVRSASMGLSPQETGMSPRNEAGGSDRREREEAARMVLMWSLVSCPGCEYQLLDEEVMAGWGDDDGYLAIRCPVCELSLVPKINFRVLGRSGQYVGNVSGTGPGEGQHEYMSPVMLRRAMERVLDKFGPMALHRMEMKRVSPAVYWNLLWYCTRLRLPNPLYLERSSLSATGEGITREFIQCGWDGGGVLVQLGGALDALDALHGTDSASSISRARRRFSRTHALDSWTSRQKDGLLDSKSVYPIFGPAQDEDMIFAKAAAAIVDSSSPPRSPKGDPSSAGIQSVGMGLISIPPRILPNNARMKPFFSKKKFFFSTLWGNKPLEQLILAEDARERSNEADLTTQASPLDVLVRLHELMKDRCLSQAVVLFLRLRKLSEPVTSASGGRKSRKDSMDSNLTAESMGDTSSASAADDDGTHATNSLETSRKSEEKVEREEFKRVPGWELFGNSMYTELLWLHRIGTDRSVSPKRFRRSFKSASPRAATESASAEDNFEANYQEALGMVPWLDKSLVTCVRPHDNPPTKWAATFRAVYGHLVP